jgi:hypothetical protein
MLPAGFRPANRPLQAGRKSALFLPFLILCTAAAQSPAAYILKLQGAWKANDRPIWAGEVVRAGERLHSGNPDDSISLVLYDGAYLKCEPGKPRPPKCAQPIDLPAEAPPNGVIAAFFDRLTNRDLPAIPFVPSRGIGPPPPVQLRDAVLSPKGLVVDFADALSGPPPSDLHVTLKPLELPPSCPTLDAKLTSHATTAGLPDLKPGCMGLYQLSSADYSMEAAAPATVLFVPAAQNDRASKLLAEAADRASQWQDASDPEKRMFLRVSLSAIRQILRTTK